MIQVDGLCRSYGSFEAVKNVSFDIEQGQIVGLLGHNGAGKTTIMKLLTGLLDPDHGNIHVDGLNFRFFKSHCHSVLGYLPENLPLYEDMFVVDYLLHVSRLKKIDESSIYQEIRRVLKETDLLTHASKKIANLSRGFKQRVGVAQAILGRPKLLILDEPTNGLDPQQTMHMRDLLRSIAKESTVILSTHIMQEVSAVCQRVLLLKNGRLVLDENLDNIHQNNALVIKTSFDQNQLEAVLFPGLQNQVHRVALIQENDKGTRTYHLFYELGVGKTHDALANQVMQCLLNSDGSCLFACYRLQRDLEGLFSEVGQS